VQLVDELWSCDPFKALYPCEGAERLKQFCVESRLPKCHEWYGGESLYSIHLIVVHNHSSKLCEGDMCGKIMDANKDFAWNISDYGQTFARVNRYDFTLN
jgi:hypothetical protein